MFKKENLFRAIWLFKKYIGSFLTRNDAFFYSRLQKNITESLYRYYWLGINIYWVHMQLHGLNTGQAVNNYMYCLLSNPILGWVFKGLQHQPINSVHKTRFESLSWRASREHQGLAKKKKETGFVMLKVLTSIRSGQLITLTSFTLGIDARIETGKGFCTNKNETSYFKSLRVVKQGWNYIQYIILYNYIWYNYIYYI